MSTIARFLPGFTQQRIEVEDVAINCVTVGEGPPVLLFHGHPQSLIVWRAARQSR